MMDRDLHVDEMIGSEPEQGLRTVRDHGPDLPIGGTGRDWKKTVQGYLSLLFGAFMAAAAVNIFYVPANLTMGGISGLATILHHVMPSVVPLGVLTIVINLPIFLAGMRIVSRRFLIDSLIGTLVYGLMIDATRPLFTQFYEQFILGPNGEAPDLVIIALFGGLLFGIGLGFTLKPGFTTGGTDIIAVLVRRKFKHFSLGQLLWVMDAAVIALSAVAYSRDQSNVMILTLYSVLALFVCAKAIDLILEGFDYKRAAFIVSKDHQSIAERILKEMDRGLTGLTGKGMYTQDTQDVLVCVLTSKEIPLLQQIVSEEDPKAFIFVMDAREVLGEGFENTQVF